MPILFVLLFNALRDVLAIIGIVASIRFLKHRHWNESRVCGDPLCWCR